MMATQNILLAGFGGQGILFSGKLAAYAGLLEGKEVSWLPSYGPEMRGGTANCSVCISDEEISSPLVLEPDVLIVMNGPSFDKFIGTVKAGGVAIVDSTLVSKKCERSDITVHYVPATQLAADNGLSGLANVILIGKLIKECKTAKLESFELAVDKSVPARKQQLVELNKKALKIGMNS